MNEVFDHILDQVQQLSHVERVTLMEEIVASLKRDLENDEKQPRDSLYGIWSDVRLSADEIDGARSEMWDKFPREDV